MIIYLYLCQFHIHTGTGSLLMLFEIYVLHTLKSSIITSADFLVLLSTQLASNIFVLTLDVYTIC